jgi:hypothetical protein
MTTTQLQLAGDLFSEKRQAEFWHDGYRIVVQEFNGDFEYEVFDLDSPAGWDHGFESEEEAKAAAINYINKI